MKYEHHKQRCHDDLTVEMVRKRLSYDRGCGALTRLRSEKSSAYKKQTVKPTGNLNSNGYLKIWMYGKSYAVHRIIWLLENGKWPLNQVDHIDGNRSNNKISNLREATPYQNQWNRKRNKNNKTGYKNVWFDKKENRYRVYMKIDGKQRTIGRYVTKEMAYQTYKDIAIKNRGEYCEFLSRS